MFDLNLSSNILNDPFRQDYLQWLQTTCQESAAAEVYERAGDYASAVTMCLKAGLPSKAAK